MFRKESLGAFMEGLPWREDPGDKGVFYLEFSSTGKLSIPVKMKFWKIEQNLPQSEFHVNEYDQLVMVLSGEGRLWLKKLENGEEDRVCLRAGKTIFISRGVPHAVELTKGYLDCTIYLDQSKERR